MSNLSKYVGVVWTRGNNIVRFGNDLWQHAIHDGNVVLCPGSKWKATINIAGNIMALGVFTTEEAAARAYDLKAEEWNRPLNFPDLSIGQVKAIKNKSKRPVVSKFKGVYWDGHINRWRAQFPPVGRENDPFRAFLLGRATHQIGFYDTEDAETIDVVAVCGLSKIDAKRCILIRNFPKIENEYKVQDDVFEEGIFEQPMVDS